jgi:hypothetical protein
MNRKKRRRGGATSVLVFLAALAACIYVCFVLWQVGDMVIKRQSIEVNLNNLGTELNTLGHAEFRKHLASMRALNDIPLTPAEIDVGLLGAEEFFVRVPFEWRINLLFREVSGRVSIESRVARWPAGAW